MEEKQPLWVRLLCGISSLRSAGGTVSARSFVHLSVLASIVLVLSLSNLSPMGFSFSVRVPRVTPDPDLSTRVVSSVSESVAATARGAESQSASSSVLIPPSTSVLNLVQAPVPHTIIPDRPRKGIIAYTVQSGDNVFAIADRFGLEHETIVWSNEELETDPDMLYIGQSVNILPVDGIYYTVQKDETVEKIAERFKSSVENIVRCPYNEFDAEWSPSVSDYPVQPGQKLVVPGGVKPFKPRVIRFFTGPIPKGAPRGDGNFVWPVGGYISQGYWNLHRAIDIAGGHGDEIVAADAGIVVYSAWDRSGYGNLVIIDHGNGFMSYYAHLYGFYVDVGEMIERGQWIGVRGSTGRSTGPHVHFEIRYNGVQRNPLGFLPTQ